MTCAGGQRDWKQVVCNGGVATELALIYMINAGCDEFAVDFRHRPGASWLVSAVLGALSCSCGDTFASEIGSVVGSWSPRLITNMQPVPRGLALFTLTNVVTPALSHRGHPSSVRLYCTVLY